MTTDETQRRRLDPYEVGVSYFVLVLGSLLMICASFLFGFGFGVRQPTDADRRAAEFRWDLADRQRSERPHAHLDFPYVPVGSSQLNQDLYWAGRGWTLGLCRREPHQERQE